MRAKLAGTNTHERGHCTLAVVAQRNSATSPHVKRIHTFKVSVCDVCTDHTVYRLRSDPASCPVPSVPTKLYRDSTSTKPITAINVFDLCFSSQNNADMLEHQPVMRWERWPQRWPQSWRRAAHHRNFLTGKNKRVVSVCL